MHFKCTCTLSLIDAGDHDVFNQGYIFDNAVLLVKLMAAKIRSENMALLRLMAIVFNPTSKYVIANFYSSLLVSGLIFNKKFLSPSLDIIDFEFLHH